MPMSSAYARYSENAGDAAAMLQRSVSAR